MNVDGIPGTIRQDALFALRAMSKKPVFAVTAVLTLALAIAGNTAIFTVVRSVLLKPLDYPDSDRLVRISGGATPARFQEMKAGAHSFSGLGAFTGLQNITLTSASEPEVLKAVRISGGFLQILGVAPLHGREFRSEEDSAGGPPVAMISTELWQRRFGEDPQIVGKTADFSGTSYTIVGILPPRFQFPVPGLDVWLTAPAAEPLLPPTSRALSPFLALFGRLKAGVNLEQANAELQVVHRQYAMAHPAMLDAKPKTPAELAPMKDGLVANVRAMLWMLLGAVALVLFIACANVAGLLLERATSRSREFAIRAALGASRSRLMGQLLAESVVLSALGGTLGVLLAAWGLRAVPHLTAFQLPRAGEIHMDVTVLAFACLLSIATGILFGLAPSIGASRPDLVRVLRSSAGTAGPDAPRRFPAGVNARGLLSVGQIALSIVLLIGVALLAESIAHLRGLALGFNPRHLFTTHISLPTVRYDTDHKRAMFFQRLLQRVESIPGVKGATVAWVLPMMGYPGIPVQDASKPPLKLNERLIAKYLPVSIDYFSTLGIPLVRGRVFTEHDTDESQRVAIIDENLARRLWPAYPGGLDPVGQRLLVGANNSKPAEIVGIVANVNQDLEGGVWPQSVYVDFAQSPQPSVVLAMRVTGDPLSFTRAVREQVQGLDRDQALANVQTMQDLVEAQIGQRRLLEILLGAFAGVALLLALIGIYGVIAYSVAQRTQEVGIRRALGAQQGDILRLVIGQGLVLALAGIGIGLTAALALTRVMKTLLFHVSATDPATFVLIAVLFLVISIAACYIPARRATRIDPMEALRV